MVTWSVHHDLATIMSSLVSLQIAFQQLALQKLTEMGKLPRGLPDIVKEGVKHLMEYINAK